MIRNLKKSFFSSFLVVLFIISNLIGNKYTNFFDMSVSINFLTYPLIILMLMLIMDCFGKKETYNTIISSLFIQIILLPIFYLVTNLGSQSLVFDLSSSINKVFKVEMITLLSSIIGFVFSSYILIYLFSYFKSIGKKVLGTFLGTVISLIIYGLIFISINYYNFGVDIIINLISGHIIMSIVMTMVVVFIFYVLKDKENIYDNDYIFINDILVKEKGIHVNNDKSVLEVINLKGKNDVKNKNVKLGSNDKLVSLSSSKTKNRKRSSVNKNRKNDSKK